jgi:hypothetical protein
MKSLFGKRASPPPAAAAQDAGALRRQVLSQLVAVRDQPAAGTDALSARLVRVIAAAQALAAADGDDALALLGGVHLVAAAAMRGVTLPTEAEARCIGHAAVALKFRGVSDDAPRTPLAALVEDRFKIARGRVRGSIYVPRDVEAAFAGDIEGLRSAAMLPDRRAVIERITRDGERAGFAWRPEDVEFIDAIVAAAGGANARD